MNQRKRIGFLTQDDARDRRSWSGIYFYMAQALQRNCGDVAYIGPLESRLTWLGRNLNRISKRITGKHYDYKRSPWYSRRISALAHARLKKLQLDYIVAPTSAVALGYLPKPRVPIVFVSDTTFALMEDYYPGFSKYLSVSLSDGRRLAKSAMSISDIVSFPSNWAACSAVQDYDIPAQRVHVIPFGANLDVIPTPEVAHYKKASGECRLLFLGVDWIRKGGDIAFETLLSLEKDHGIKAHLTVCGCSVPEGFRHERLVETGFMDKRDPLQAKQLQELFLRTDYLLLPTRSECYGIVFSEASAYGVPSIATDTGGVGGVIREGKNGFLLPLAARGVDYARKIAEIESKNGCFEALCRSARKEYDQRLDWDLWAREIDRLVDKLGAT